MAFRIIRALITNSLKHENTKNNVAAGILVRPSVPLIQSTRNIQFLIKRTAVQLWKSTTGVSNAGKRRGRGKVAPKIKDLNRNQKIGAGKIAITLPGLNTNPLDTQQIQIQEQEEDELKNQTQPEPTKKRMKLHPMERGWTGATPCGRSYGPPNPVDGENFDGFNSWVVNYKQKNIMTSLFGRTKRINAAVIVGNGNGLAGFANANGSNTRSCIQIARNKAAQRLIHYERHNGHTVLHDFYSQFGHTKVFVRRAPEGRGLICDRLIATCCKAIGIKDIIVRIEGSGNKTSLLRAFFIGLLQQKTHETLANEKNLLLVELQKGRCHYPKVLGTPEVIRSEDELLANENLNVNVYTMGDRYMLKRKILPRFYTKLPSYTRFMRKQERLRDQFDTKIKLRAEYGEICSYLTEKYPEARPDKWVKPKKDKVEG